LLKKLDDLAGQFVRLLGPALAGHKPGQAILLERGLSLIKRWT